MQSCEHIVGEDVRGFPLTIKSFHWAGRQADAPSVYIQASIHGAELQGNAVIAAVLKALEATPPLGNVTIVPQCNPIGGNHKVGEYTQGRFDPMTGENWNSQYFCPTDDWIAAFARTHQHMTRTALEQVFRQALLTEIEAALQVPWQLSRGQFLAYSLQRMACQADYVLDLHTGSQAARYLYLPRYAEAAAQYLHQEHVLLMENKFGGALDEATFVPWWTLEQQLQSLGYASDGIQQTEGVTVELGSQEQLDQARADFEAAGILAYLSAKGVLPTDAYLPNTTLKRYIGRSEDLLTFYAPHGGLYEFLCAPGACVNQGDVFAQCLQVINYGEQPIVKPVHAPFSGRLVNQIDSAAVPKGAELAKFLCDAVVVS